MVGIKDIARHAGTSPSAVSRAINNSGYVSREVRCRIEKAIAELNYEPNSGARTLRSGRSNLVGVLLPSLEVEFFSQLAHRLEQRLFVHGYQALICSTAEDPTREEAYLRTFAAKQIDGLLMVVVGAGPGGLDQLIGSGVPIIALDRQVDAPNVLSIGADHEMGGRLAAEHVLSLGHSRILILGAPSHSEPVRLRARGMQAVIAASGLPVPEPRFSDSHTMSACEDLVHSILAEPGDPPTAILSTSDVAAVGAMRAVKGAGLDVPHDVSIMGFDDNPIAHCVWPGLTTIRQPVDAIVEHAVENLLARMKDRGKGHAETGETIPEKGTISLEVTLVKRNSTAAPR